MAPKSLGPRISGGAFATTARALRMMGHVTSLSSSGGQHLGIANESFLTRTLFKSIKKISKGLVPNMMDGGQQDTYIHAVSRLSRPGNRKELQITRGGARLGGRASVGRWRKQDTDGSYLTRFRSAPARHKMGGCYAF